VNVILPMNGIPSSHLTKKMIMKHFFSLNSRNPWFS